MPKATRKAAPSSSNKDGGKQGNSNKNEHQQYPDHPYAANDDFIVIHDHDVLNGRGVNMAHHPGNERFRSLIQSRSDPAYCATYTLDEKKALAEDIIRHIESLDPPGRFLKRSGKAKNKRGPWELMTREEAIKKARQALRDCNRPDRVGYAKSVAPPSDVVESAYQVKSMGLTQQQYVQKLVAANPSSASNSGRSTPASTSFSAAKAAPKPTPVTSPVPTHPYNGYATANRLEWIDKTVAVAHGSDLDLYQEQDPSQTTPHLRTTTPTTAATSGGDFFADDEPHDFGFNHHHGMVDVEGAPTLDSPTHHPSFAQGFGSSPPHVGPFEESLDLPDDDIKPRAVSSFNHSHHDPLQEEDAAALASAFDDDEGLRADFDGEESGFRGFVF